MIIRATYRDANRKFMMLLVIAKNSKPRHPCGQPIFIVGILPTTRQCVIRNENIGITLVAIAAMASI